MFRTMHVLFKRLKCRGMRLPQSCKEKSGCTAASAALRRGLQGREDISLLGCRGLEIRNLNCGPSEKARERTTFWEKAAEVHTLPP